MEEEIPEWATQAALELDEVLGEIVTKNTGRLAGIFAGISVNDIAKIILKNKKNYEKQT